MTIQTEAVNGLATSQRDLAFSQKNMAKAMTMSAKTMTISARAAGFREQRENILAVLKVYKDMDDMDGMTLSVTNMLCKSKQQATLLAMSLS